MPNISFIKYQSQLQLRSFSIWRKMKLYYSTKISLDAIFPQIISSLEQFTPFNSFPNNYSIHEVKNCQNAETIWKFPHFPLSKKNSFRGNYMRKYSILYHQSTKKCLKTSKVQELFCRLFGVQEKSGERFVPWSLNLITVHRH